MPIRRQIQTRLGWTAVCSSAETEIEWGLLIALTCRSGGWLVHPHGGRFPTGRPHRKHQTIHFRHKERGAGPGNRCNASNARIGAVRRVEHIQEAFAATDVDSTPTRVDEQVVGIPANIWARD